MPFFRLLIYGMYSRIIAVKLYQQKYKLII